MKRVREQLRSYGAKTLSTAELLALVLFKGKKKDAVPLAYTLLETYGTKGLRNSAFDGLCREAGLSPTQAERLHALCELAQRFAVADPEERIQIVTPDDVAALLRPSMAHLDHEELRVLVLDTKNHVVANILLYTGTVNGTLLRAAEIFRQAIVRNCPKVIVCHNHPGGESTPSPEDCEVTMQLVEAGRVLDIELLDHIIVSSSGYVSMKDQLGWD